MQRQTIENLLRESEKWAYLESLRVFQAQLLKKYKNRDPVNFHVQIVMMSKTGNISCGKMKGARVDEKAISQNCVASYRAIALNFYNLERVKQLSDFQQQL